MLSEEELTILFKREMKKRGVDPSFIPDTAEQLGKVVKELLEKAYKEGLNDRSALPF